MKKCQDLFHPKYGTSPKKCGNHLELHSHAGAQSALCVEGCDSRSVLLQHPSITKPSERACGRHCVINVFF